MFPPPDRAQERRDWLLVSARHEPVPLPDWRDSGLLRCGQWSSFQTTRVSPSRRVSSAWSSPGRWVLVPLIVSS